METERRRVPDDGLKKEPQKGQHLLSKIIDAIFDRLIAKTGTYLGPALLTVVLATIAFAIWAAFDGNPEEIVNYQDAVEMNHAASYPWWSSKFWFAPRPFLWVASFKAVFHSGWAIIVVQTLAHFASWMWLVYTIWLHTRSRAVRALAVLGGCAFMAEPVVTYWMSQVLSESISISLGAASLAAWLHLLHRHDRTRAILAVTMPALWALQRDSNTAAIGFGVVCASVALSAMWVLRLRNRSRGDNRVTSKDTATSRWAMTLFACVLIWSATGIFIASAGVKAHRWEWAVIDQTILKADRDPEVIDDWLEQGMPYDAAFASQRRFAGVIPDWMVRPDLFQYQQWLVTKGRSSAVKVQMKNFGSFLSEAMAVANNVSIGDQGAFLNWPQRRVPVLSSIFYPRDASGVSFWVFGSIALFLISLRFERRNLLFVVLLVFAIAVVATIFVSFQGDPYAESDRHLATSVVTYRALWFVVGLIGLDGVIHSVWPRILGRFAALAGVESASEKGIGTKGSAEFQLQQVGHDPYGFPSEALSQRGRALLAASGFAVFAGSLLLGLTTLFPQEADSRSQRTFELLPGSSQDKSRLTDRIDPSFSPGGKKMAWVVNSEGSSQIEVMNVATQKVTQVTDTPHMKAQPVFSPDGKKIAFVAAPYTPQPTGVFVVDLQSGAVAQAAAHQWAAWAPMWSRDGKKDIVSVVLHWDTAQC